jgi:hypothetical protein
MTTARQTIGRRLARAPAHILRCSTDYEIGTTETVAPPFPAFVGPFTSPHLLHPRHHLQHGGSTFERIMAHGQWPDLIQF